MAFNGSGVFNRLYNWVNDAAVPIKIRADRMDAEMDGMATGLSTCVTKDGQTTITANLPMSTYRHTGVGNAAARTDYAAFGQVQDGKTNWVDGGGTADAITAGYTVPLTTLVDGQLCFVRATAANATTTPTFSPSGLTARTIVKRGGTALLVGDIVGDGHELILRYDLTNTRWELLNPRDSILAANNTFTGTTTLTGAVAVAGTASASASVSLAEDTDNGTNKVTIIAPASLAADYTLTLPGNDGSANQVTITDGSGTLSFVDIASINHIPQNSQSTDYTCVLGDANGHMLHPSADTTPRTFTIPANASVAYTIGTAITFVNQASAGTLTIAITSDTMRLAGAGTTGSRTLAANGIATALKITSTEWIINGTGLT